MGARFLRSLRFVAATLGLENFSRKYATVGRIIMYGDFITPTPEAQRCQNASGKVSSRSRGNESTTIHKASFEILPIYLSLSHHLEIHHAITLMSVCNTTD